MPMTILENKSCLQRVVTSRCRLYSLPSLEQNARLSDEIELRYHPSGYIYRVGLFSKRPFPLMISVDGPIHITILTSQEVGSLLLGGFTVTDSETILSLRMMLESERTMGRSQCSYSQLVIQVRVS